MAGASGPSPSATIPSASNVLSARLLPSSLAVKRSAQEDPVGSVLPAQKKRVGSWTAEEDEKLAELRGKGMKWDDISNLLPGRSPISCRLRYQNYLERRTVAEPQGQTSDATRLVSLFRQPQQSEQRRFQCVVCGHAFSTQRLLKYHVHEHALREAVFTCRHCPFRFRAIERLVGHIASEHPTPERLTCMICGEALETAAALCAHFQRCRRIDQQLTPDGLQQISLTSILNSIEGPSDANPTEHNPGSSNRSQRHPPEAIEVLQRWLDSHSIKRYLTTEEKQRLATESGLSVAQVSTWFSNARSRHRSPLDDWIASAPEGKTTMESCIANEWSNLMSSSATSLPLPSYSTSDMVDFPLTPRSRAGSACSAFSQCGDAIRSGPPRRGRRKYSTPAPISPFGTQSQSPVASAWLPGSPATQHSRTFSPASVGYSYWTNPLTSPTANAFAAVPLGQFVDYPECPIELQSTALPAPMENFPFNDSQLAPSPSFQFEKTESAHHGSVNPQDEQQLGPTDQPFASHQKKESHDEHISRSDSGHQSTKKDVCDAQDCVSQIAQTFQCTFCLKHLSPKSWKRHEETMHLPRFQWVCQPQGVPTASGSSQSDPSSPVSLSHCVFCNAWQPEAAHFETCHRAKECADKPRSERAFARKDHLMQHWKNFHGRRLDPKTAESWKVPINYSGHKWSCGFCGVQLGDWEERATHIPKHFREGLTMDFWDSEKGRLDGEDALFKQFINIA